MTAPSSPEPRRLSTPRWLDLRLVLGVVLVLVSVLVGATVVSRAGDTHASVTTTRELAVGTVLRAGDVTTAEVQLPDDGKGVYLDDVDAAIGKVLRHGLARGELVPAAAIAAVPARTTVTVSLAAGNAPDLRAGERIELWLSTPSCAFVVLLPDVTVQAVRSGDAGSFGDAGSGQNVVISIDPALASRIVAAQSIESGQLRAGVLEGGKDPVSQSAPSTPTSDVPVPTQSAPAGLPADLAACATPSAGR